MKGQQHRSEIITMHLLFQPAGAQIQEQLSGLPEWADSHYKWYGV